MGIGGGITQLFGQSRGLIIVHQVLDLFRIIMDMIRRIAGPPGQIQFPESVMSHDPPGRREPLGGKYPFAGARLRRLHQFLVLQAAELFQRNKFVG